MIKINSVTKNELLGLEKTLEKYKDRKVIILQHFPLLETRSQWLQTAKTEEYENLLKKYKNVFLISGHIHNGFSNDATSDFYGFNSVDSDGSFHSINLPSYMYMTIRGRVANGTGFQFEVYEDRVEIRARSYSADVWYTDYNYTIPLV